LPALRIKLKRRKRKIFKTNFINQVSPNNGMKMLGIVYRE
jgi:hypothetical protein